jgi:predicted DNA-binding protein (MmcQ/YjbR family)
VLVAGGGLPDDELLDLLEESYAAVVARLPKRERPAG